MSAKDERIDIKEPKLLIVEGRDEQLFFEAALQNYLGLTGIQVMPVGGKNKLTRSIEIIVNDVQFPKISSVAILRDADTPFGDAPPPMRPRPKPSRRFNPFVVP